jgi:hypothetical protein
MSLTSTMLSLRTSTGTTSVFQDLRSMFLQALLIYLIEVCHVLWGNSKHAMYYADVSEHIALHRYFRDASDEKRERAETLMRYQVGKIVS